VTREHFQTAQPRVAVVGVGRWGANIVRDLVGLGISVVAIDADASARQRAIELGAVEAKPHLTGDEGLDAVVVATPATSHERDVLGVAHLGVPVACEKPLSVSSESAGRIVDAVGDRLTVLHVWRYHPGIELLGELARSGRLGTVNAIHTVRTNWTSPRTDIDPVWTLLPHDLSIAIEILGHLPEPTNAVVERIDGCAVGVWATFGSDPVVVVDASTRGQRRRDVRVHGTDAVALLNESDPYVRVLSGNATTPHEERLAFDATPALRRELAAFVEHVRGGDAPKTDAEEGLAVVSAVERALAHGTPR
jgi:predicted dehydrogenase